MCPPSPRSMWRSISSQSASGDLRIFLTQELPSKVPDGGPAEVGGDNRVESEHRRAKRSVLQSCDLLVIKIAWQLQAHLDGVFVNGEEAISFMQRIRQPDQTTTRLG